MTKIADPHSLAIHEALMIEGSWDQYTDKELASYLPSSGYTPVPTCGDLGKLWASAPGAEGVHQILYQALNTRPIPALTPIAFW